MANLGGAIYNPRGLQVQPLLAHASTAGTVAGFASAEPVHPARLLELPCDVLIPAAAASQITRDNAARICAKIVIEGANGPTTPQADRILESRSVQVIPDILANAGGVFVSYLEYTQETQQEQMTEQEVNARLGQRMADRYRLVEQTMRQMNCSMRDAAMYLAVRNVAAATLARGLLP